MAFADELQILERKLERANVPVAEVLAETRTHRTTWGRWKQGKAEPRWSHWEAITAAATEALRRGGA